MDVFVTSARAMIVEVVGRSVDDSERISSFARQKRSVERASMYEN